MRTLLSDLPGPERHRVQESGVPRTTYQTIRHRAFINGWLKERYLPDPALLGVDRIRFIVAQPYAERWNNSIRALRSQEGLVVLWASPETLFGVVFEQSSQRSPDVLRSPESLRRYWTVVSSTRGDGPLAYFDYEGIWSRWTMDSDPIVYPRPLPRAKSPVLATSREDWVAVRDLLARPFGSGSSQPGTVTFRSTHLSRRERRLLADGRISYRVLPNLSEIPPVRGYRPEHLAFIVGDLQPGQNPRELFGNLVQRAHVAPILYAYDDHRVLLMALSPAPARIAKGRTSVVAVLQKHLQKIEVVREMIDSLYPLVDHRYDRLVRVSPAPSIPPPVETGHK